MAETNTQDYPLPLADFRYCPRCGAPGLARHSKNAVACKICDLQFYANTAAAVACFIIDPAGQLLCARRAFPPAAGTLDLPGGFVSPDETVEEALCREILEETGIAVDPAGVEYLFSLPNVYPYKGINVRTADLFFEVRLPDLAAAKPADDVAELLCLPLARIQPDDFGLTSVRCGLRRYLARKSKNRHR